MKSPQSAGGQAAGIINRAKALANYYSSPRYCRACKSQMVVRDDEKIQRAKRREFCNHSCAGGFLKNLRPRQKTKKCSDCDTLVYASRKRCPPCIASAFSRALESEVSYSRRMVAYYAREALKDVAKVCASCGWDKFVEACHIKPISSFSPDTKLKVVNAKENLKWLCPNCHWEFDHQKI